MKLNHVCAFEVTTACRHVAAQTDPDGVVQREEEEPMITVQLRDEWGLVPVSSTPFQGSMFSQQLIFDSQEQPPASHSLPSMDAQQYSVERVLSPRQSSVTTDKAHTGSVPADKPRKGSSSTSQGKDSDDSTDSDEMAEEL